MEQTNKIYDCIVIGGGPAGVTAAVYAVRGGLDVLLIHNGASALHKTSRIQNYYGFADISGVELYDAGIAQAANIGVNVLSGEVTFVKTDGTLFYVSAHGNEYLGKTAIIALGAARKPPEIGGIKELEGKGVSYCAVCDGFFYRKKRVGVVGAGEYAEHEYSFLKGVAGETFLLTNGDVPSFEADKTVAEKIVRVVENNGRLAGVEFDGGKTIELDGLFVASGVMGGVGLCKSLGVFTDERGNIKTDERGMTNIDGLFAAGDCTSGIKQIGKAVADGMTAGMSAIAFVKALNG